MAEIHKNSFAFYKGDRNTQYCKNEWKKCTSLAPCRGAPPLIRKAGMEASHYFYQFILIICYARSDDGHQLCRCLSVRFWSRQERKPKSLTFYMRYSQRHLADCFWKHNGPWPDPIRQLMKNHQGNTCHVHHSRQYFKACKLLLENSSAQASLFSILQCRGSLWFCMLIALWSTCGILGKPELHQKVTDKVSLFRSLWVLPKTAEDTNPFGLFIAPLNIEALP